MRSDGSVPGSTERNGIFHGTDDPFYHRYSRSPDYLDLWTVPFTQITDFLVSVLSGILDCNDHHAGDLLLVCKEEVFGAQGVFYIKGCKTYFADYSKINVKGCNKNGIHASNR